MPVTFIHPPHGDVNAMVVALQTIKPGEEIAFGVYGSNSAIGMTELDDSRLVKKTVAKLESANRVMLFHRKVGRQTWHMVARGIQPEIKKKLEEALTRYPLPGM